MTFFDEIFGFRERDYYSTQKKLLSMYADGKINNIDVGEFDIYKLKDLIMNQKKKIKKGSVKFEIIYGDVGKMHKMSKYKDAVFQVASQFNCLEFINPNITPEHGIGIYENDHTQGPVCAIVCPAATAYRNYLVPVNNKIGQTKNNQINLLKECELLFKVLLWNMKNGYLFSSKEQLEILNEVLEKKNWKEKIRDNIQVGVHKNAGVVKNNKQIHNVTQVFCSTAPVYYQNIPIELWEPFCRLLLESCYESTLWTTIRINEERKLLNKKPVSCFLTSIGGGVFGNKQSWIDDAISLAIKTISDNGYSLKVYLIKYKSDS